MMGKQAAETMSITEWDPPRSYTVEATSHGAHYRTPITFDPLPDGSTRVTMTFHATPMTLGARIMMRVFAFMAKHAAKCLQNDLKDIKAACEAGQ